jgi:hypothetical protein
MEKEKDLVGFAHKIISFRMNVIKACKAKNVEPPTDEQIGEYINSYGFNVNDCVADFIEHEGMFRHLKTPLELFKDEINKISWYENPTETEIVSFFNEHGNNIDLFCTQRTINGMKPLVRKTYLKTIEKLSTERLVILWNTFIEESAIYGEDSYIYDLEYPKDIKFLREHMDEHIDCEGIKCIGDLAKNGIRFIQWFALNDKSIQGRTDDNIKRIITAYWSEIFERIMLYPSAYNFNVEIYCEGDGSTYFDDVFFPIIAKEVGYIIDGDKGIIKEIEK